MSAKMDMQELLKQFLAAQNNGGTVTLPVATAPAAPAAPVPTPELTAVTAELAIAPAPTTVVEPAPAKANGKREWQSCDVEVPGGEKLHLRVAPKGYGCFGFESRGDYACIYGYKQRMEGLCAMFGEGFRNVVMDRLIAMGLRDYPNGKD